MWTGVPGRLRRSDPLSLTAMAGAAGQESDPCRGRRRGFAALVVIFLVVALTRAGLLWWEYQHTLAAEQRRAEDLAPVLAEHLNRTFGAIESAVNQLAVHSAGVGGPGAQRQEWSEVLEEIGREHV